MLTKTLKFDAEVLDVLKAMQWEDEGRLGIITGGQLERGLYQRVNKALDAMGGSWNRGRKGHVFPLDPRPQVEGLLESGALVVERDGFFETPDAVIETMLSLVTLEDDMRVLEPSAGLGKIAGHLVVIVGVDNLVCVEKNEQRAAYLFEQRGYTTYCKDFLEYKPTKLFDRVYMNPPFEELQDVAHVMHAHSLLKPGGEMAFIYLTHQNG